VAHFSPLQSVHRLAWPEFGILRPILFIRSDPASALTLAKGDVVKIHLGERSVFQMVYRSDIYISLNNDSGAHIDGYAATSAETLIVGATEEDPATGRAADAGESQEGK
jgi:methionine aminopeptidase